jgi:FkbM family methyltransferase
MMMTASIAEHSVYLARRWYRICDAEGSQAASIVSGELLSDVYQISGIHLGEGDIVLDIGGHIGLFAIYVATRWPGVQVHSFEAYPPNADLFEHNVAESGLTNIHLNRMAVTGDGLPIQLSFNPTNSGGTTSFSRTLTPVSLESIPSITLDDIFSQLGISDCSLLKIDCEGAEYGILHATTMLGRVRHLRGEFHTNDLLASYGRDPHQLANQCRQAAPNCELRYGVCEITP